MLAIHNWLGAVVFKRRARLRWISILCFKNELAVPGCQDCPHLSSRYSLVVRNHPSLSQFRCYSPIAVTASVFQSNLLDRGPDRHVLLDRGLARQSK
jgi:hypothetical protein